MFGGQVRVGAVASLTRTLKEHDVDCCASLAVIVTGVVPNGKVKLLNALPFAPADLRRHSLAEAWQAYRDAWRGEEVREFVARCSSDPNLLLHANETWECRRPGVAGEPAPFDDG